jgi:hypothetical protein
MKNIFKAFTAVTPDRSRNSHDVMIEARRFARQTRIAPDYTRWSTSQSK